MEIHECRHSSDDLKSLRKRIVKDEETSEEVTEQALSLLDSILYALIDAELGIGIVR
jgi:hypothetical protein